MKPDQRRRYVLRAVKLRRQLSDKAMAVRFNVCVETIKRDRYQGKR